MTSIKQTQEVLSYVKKFNGMTVVIKVGGAVLEETSRLHSLCEDISYLRASGLKVVVVHGGSTMINTMLTKLGITWSFIDGQRVTTPDMIDVIEMVLTGHINPKFKRGLSLFQVPAMGISGSHQGFLTCDYADPKLGEVGRITSIKSDLLLPYLESQKTLKDGVVPVISPIGFHPSGKALNINADWVASQIAISIGAHKLIYMSDQDGILDADKKLVSRCVSSDLEAMISSKEVTGGMLTKVQTVLSGLKAGLSHIHIINGLTPHALIQELFTVDGIGTLCSKRI
jgi:acetylglutamate kinase